MDRVLPLAVSLSVFIGAQAAAQTAPATTLGGYGELHYNEPDGAQRGVLDFHRFVLTVSHAFNDRLTFRSELEIEHTRIEAGDPEGGELAIEQAVLDYRITDGFGVRGGIMLIPVGLINLVHEPPSFHGVERPQIDRVIIPTTWREAGAGIFGTIGDEVGYQLSVVAGLRASGFSAAGALRGGRQSGFESTVANPSLTGRADYSPLAGLQLGGSFFVGNSSADEDSIGNAAVALWSADVRYDAGLLLLRAVGALGTIGDADLINARYGGNVADRFYGYSFEGAYNILPLLAPETEQDLFMVARFEKYNTQAGTSGFDALARYDRHDILLGLTYRPVSNAALKVDYIFMNNALNNGASPNTKTLNLGIGYFFN